MSKYIEGNQTDEHGNDFEVEVTEEVVVEEVVAEEPAPVVEPAPAPAPSNGLTRTADGRVKLPGMR